jgi:ribosomal protein S18 acetylase RimI-like enzyme
VKSDRGNQHLLNSNQPSLAEVIAICWLLIALIELSLLFMAISLRLARQEDQEFLFKLYASTRQAEVAAFGWDPTQQEAFLRMQFNAQRRSYASAYPAAVEQIVELDRQPAGRLVVARGDGAVATLVDIALLPEHCGGGIGGGLLRDLLDRCKQEQTSLRLQVLKTNPAARLYERLGFVKVGEDGVYFQMEKRPS